MQYSAIQSFPPNPNHSEITSSSLIYDHVIDSVHHQWVIRHFTFDIIEQCFVFQCRNIRPEEWRNMTIDIEVKLLNKKKRNLTVFVPVYFPLSASLSPLSLLIFLFHICVFGSLMLTKRKFMA